VLKIIGRGDQEHDLQSTWYWKHELHAVQSALLTWLPGQVWAPRIYAATEHTDSAWIWMEHIGVAIPGATVAWTGDESGEVMQQAVGRDGVTVVAQWANLCEVGLDRADEARLRALVHWERQRYISLVTSPTRSAINRLATLGR
jgi:hypothetical protein